MRVELIYSNDEYTRLRPGTRGTVRRVDSLGTVHVNWDDGSRLGLIPGEDMWTEVRDEGEGGDAENDPDSPDSNSST